MANYAVIRDGIVENTIVVDSKEEAEKATGLTCIEYTDENPAGPGWTFNGTTFEPPAITE